MTPDLTREEMIERLIDNTYESMDLKDLYRYVEYFEQREYANWTTEQIETEYSDRFKDDWLFSRICRSCWKRTN